MLFKWLGGVRTSQTDLYSISPTWNLNYNLVNEDRIQTTLKIKDDFFFNLFKVSDLYIYVRGKEKKWCEKLTQEWAFLISSQACTRKINVFL